MVVTDESWEWAPSPEHPRGPLRRSGHRRPGLLFRRPAAVTTCRPLPQAFGPTSTADRAPGVRRTAADLVFPFRRLLDRLRQNLVGWLRLSVHRVPVVRHLFVARHAEGARGGAGSPSTLFRAPGCVRRTRSSCPAEIPDVFEPHPSFTFHGFRYAEVLRLTRLTTASSTCADSRRHLLSIQRSAVPRPPSHPQLNRFHENVVWDTAR